jgi:ABC-type glycerol-3-phosphate transport system substrate-binding protein
MNNSQWQEVLDDLDEGKLSRKQFIKRTAVLGASLSSIGWLLQSCSGGTEPREKSDTLRVGVYAYIPDVIAIDEIAKNYERKSGLKVEVEAFPGSVETVEDVVRKFTLESRSNRASYDLIFGTTPWLDVAPLAAAGALTPVDDYLPDDLVSSLASPAKEEGTFAEDGKMYSIPTWTDITGFIYRNDYLKRATGTDQPPTTWDEVLATAETLRSELPDDISAYGADWTFSHRLFLPLLFTLTDTPYTDDGRWNMEDDGAVEALEWIRRLHPFMPRNADQDLGSSEVFQAGRLATETYWQAQMFRALSAGIPEGKIGLAGNPRNEFEGTIFWDTSAAVPKASPMAEEAVNFWVDGFLKDEFALEQSYETAAKVVPYDHVSEMVTVPEWAETLGAQLGEATYIPMNTAWTDVEQPAFLEEVQRMILEDQSAEDTRANIAEKIAQGES